jgi:histidine triad (HIT) family protein
MADCLFCKIAAREIPSDLVHEDDHLVAFGDINPQAPTHVLIIPRRHISTLNDLTAGDADLVGKMVHLASRIAADRGHAEEGYRTVFNCNAAAGQTVFHIHLHLLAGRDMTWPPG